MHVSDSPFAAARAGQIPTGTVPVVDGIEMPDGRARPDEDAFFWATDAPVSDPGRFTKPLAAAFARTGLWPVLWEWEEDPADYYFERPEVRDADASAAEAVLRAFWSDVAEPGT